MGKGFYKVPVAVNEPVKTYAPGSTERAAVATTYTQMYNTTIDVPMYINGKEVATGDTATMSPPHDHKHILGTYHRAEKKHIEEAISTALEARKLWSQMPWEQRAAIFYALQNLLQDPTGPK